MNMKLVTIKDKKNGLLYDAYADENDKLLWGMSGLEHWVLQNMLDAGTGEIVEEEEA